MAISPFHVLNSNISIPTPFSTAFTLAPAVSFPTDIWRKPGPPLINTFNAPLIYKSISLSQFQRARVTVSGDWSKLFDQGGLVFILPSSDGSTGEQRGQAGKWVKTGIEFFEGAVYVSTVACDAYADWSLVQTGIREEREVTLELERKAGDDTFWVYIVDGQKRVPVREVTWVLSEKEREVWVGVYAATPTVEAGKTLEVEFNGFELELR